MIDCVVEMRLTAALISDFVRCRFKYWQQLKDQGEHAEYEVLQAELNRAFRRQAISHQVELHAVDDVVERPQSISAVLHTERHLILDFECETDGFQVSFDAIERSGSKRNGKHELVPIHFCPITPSRHDKTIAACTGVLLERVQDIPGRVCKTDV